MSIKFDIISSKLVDGIKIIKPSVSFDSRGTIWTSYLKDEIDNLLPEGLYFKHDKFSESKKNVLRGIHGDKKTWKLVTAVYGEIYQVAVDCRETSQTFAKWEKYIFHKNEQTLVLIPPGVGNAYCVMSDRAVYHYKLAYEENYSDVENQFTIAWNDPKFNIKWPTKFPILSDRDSVK